MLSIIFIIFVLKRKINKFRIKKNLRNILEKKMNLKFKVNAAL